MPGEPSEFSSCGACGRTILRGERVVDYISSDVVSVGVCSLCRPAAERAGWLRADLVGTIGAAAPARRRGLGLRGRLSRATETARELAARPARKRAPEQQEAPSSAPDSPQPPAAPPVPLTPEHLMRRAVERFNATDERRKVAGLIRSLGEPRVAVATGDGDRVLITVAWELSWYQWEIGDGDDPAVHEVGKGSEIAELGDGEPDWNARVDSNGTLGLEAAAARTGSASG